MKSKAAHRVSEFVDRYEVETHQLLANVRMEPHILYCSFLDGGHDVRNRVAQDRIECGLYVGHLCMVVMECVAAEEGAARSTNVHEQMEEATKLKLRDAGLVSGDLRPPNVLFPERKVSFIYFDWAGRVDESEIPLWPLKRREVVGGFPVPGTRTHRSRA